MIVRQNNTAAAHPDSAFHNAVGVQYGTLRCPGRDRFTVEQVQMRIQTEQKCFFFHCIGQLCRYVGAQLFCGVQCSVFPELIQLVLLKKFGQQFQKSWMSASSTPDREWNVSIRS